MALLRQKRWSAIAALTMFALILNLISSILLVPGWDVVGHAISLILLVGLILAVSRELARAQERQHVILEIGREMATKIEMGDLLDYVVNVILTLAPLADKCVIHLLDEEGRRLYPRYSSQPDWQQHLGLPAGKGIAGRALRENTTIMIGDTSQSPEFLPQQSSSDLRALLVAPLKFQDQALGTMSLNSRVADAFTPDDQTLMTILASQISLALHQSLLYQEAQREKHYVESLLLHLPDGIAVLDEHNHLIRYNVALAHLLGADVGRLIGKTVAPDSSEIGLQRLALMLAPPGPDTASTFAKRIELQEPVPSILDVTVLTVEDHNAKCETIIMVRDETRSVEMIQAEADLMAAAAREIMPGVASIRGYAALLRGSLADQPEVRGWAAEIQAKSNELADRSRDLDFLRILYAGELEHKIAPTRLSDMLAELAELVRPKLDDKEMSLEIEIEGTSQEATVLLEGDRLEHALHNLLSNAIHRGYRDGQIVLRLAVGAEDVTITIADNGRALRLEERQRIFYGVYRLDGAKQEAPAGTGLALFVSRSLIEAMEGHLWLEQNQIVGVQVSIVLPLQQAAH